MYHPVSGHIDWMELDDRLQYVVYSKFIKMKKNKKMSIILKPKCATLIVCLIRSKRL
jgi:hypothetical protein